MKSIYISAPCYYDLDKDTQDLRRYRTFVESLGYNPLWTPHEYICPAPDYLSEEYESIAETKLIKESAEVWVFSDDLTAHMEREIEDADRENIPVRYFSSECVELDGEEEMTEDEFDISEYLNSGLTLREAVDILDNSNVWTYIDEVQTDDRSIKDLNDFVLAVGYAVGFMKAHEE